MPSSECVVKVSALDVPQVVNALARLKRAAELLGDIAQDPRVPPEHRQRVREWAEMKREPSP